MKRTSQLFSFVLVVVLGLAVGCGKKPDDRKISSDIQGKFSQDSGLSTKQLTVQANQGVVTLGGTVDNEAQREAAEAYIQSQRQSGWVVVTERWRKTSAMSCSEAPCRNREVARLCRKRCAAPRLGRVTPARCNARSTISETAQ